MSLPRERVMNVKQAKIMVEACEERIRQDKKWGGSEHDDLHSTHDWYDFIRSQVSENEPFRHNRTEFRRRMVKVAALAMAAIESFDRRFAQ